MLERINGPDDLAGLTLEELGTLAGELRTTIIETVSRTGGHLAANLGVVELTIALLRTFHPPEDKIIWDVSHQAYAYKLLTGRRDRFGTLRQYGGLSGFLAPRESPYDCFGAGHSGTALSAALGFAAARDRLGGREHVVAVIGDGALGCGLSLEALNNVEGATSRLIVIVNDNEMSISENVGSLARQLGELLASPRYNDWKRKLEAWVGRLSGGPSWLRRMYFKIEEALKGLFLHSIMFEEFGLRYVGPIDGHDIKALLSAFDIARRAEQPILIHVATQKGRGYPLAEAYPEQWHGAAPFDVATGAALSGPGAPTYSQAFGNAVEMLAARDERVVAITAAMPAGTGLTGFAQRFPNRFFDVGISEEHAVVFAAGLAARGLRPFVAIYSTFAQRVVDGIIHDVCLQNLPVVLCLDRAGIVGDDGPTHHGVFDLALFRTTPNLTIMQPRSLEELAHMMFTALQWERPVIIRYPRGVGPGLPAVEEFLEVPYGEAETMREGWQAQIWALGDMIPLALAAADRLAEEGISVGVVNARFVRPLDRKRLAADARYARVFATIENGVAAGGFGSAVEEALVEMRFQGAMRRFGWPEQFIPHGANELLMERYGLTPDAIAAELAKALKRLEQQEAARSSQP